jgi:hypothetical protein
MYVASLAAEPLNNIYISASIATVYELNEPNAISINERFFSCPQRPDRLWGLPSLLSNGYWGSFFGGKAVGAKARPLPHLVPRLRVCGAISPSPYVFVPIQENVQVARLELFTCGEQDTYIERVCSQPLATVWNITATRPRV